ncbi:EspF repeat-containing protein [Sulfitobacter sp. F26169L]
MSGRGYRDARFRAATCNPAPTEPAPTPQVATTTQTRPQPDRLLQW